MELISKFDSAEAAVKGVHEMLQRRHHGLAVGDQSVARFVLETPVMQTRDQNRHVEGIARAAADPPRNRLHGGAHDPWIGIVEQLHQAGLIVGIRDLTEASFALRVGDRRPTAPTP